MFYTHPNADVSVRSIWDEPNLFILDGRVRVLRRLYDHVFYRMASMATYLVPGRSYTTAELIGPAVWHSMTENDRGLIILILQDHASKEESNLVELTEWHDDQPVFMIKHDSAQ